jgi:hypothetical protein
MYCWCNGRVDSLDVSAGAFDRVLEGLFVVIN